MIEGGVAPGMHADVCEGRVLGREAIMFMGPAMQHAVEAWEVHLKWDVQRTGDGQAIAVHPARSYWLRKGEQYRSQVEMPLADFKTAVVAANQNRLDEHGGRTGAKLDTPMVQSDATKLHQHHIDIGNTTHPDGPPSQDLPPACGKAVPDYANNSGLMRDCETLLEAKDALRGTAALNWSVDVTIADWDGVTVEGTPGRVTRLSLPSKSLTGTIPAALARLDLTTLKLAGNTLTGCIPVALQDVPTNDLDDLGLPDCPE